jgi:NAD(P)-dependent dehydrogenase (short-subunit alcohol dehydrogenase family)
MGGKTVLITGGTHGIGRAAATALAAAGARVILVGRDEAKARQVRDAIAEETGNAAVSWRVADLSAMGEVARVADAVLAELDRLDVLINNAGAVFSARQLTVDGYERTLALNHLAYFLLTTRLLGLLTASAPSRIVNVSSDAHQVGRLDFDDLQSEHGMGRGGFSAYGRTKLMNVLFTYELARRLAGTGVTANAVHPGNVATGFGHNNAGPLDWFMRLVAPLQLRPEQGADTVVYLAASPEVEGVSGKYFYQRRPVRSSAASYDEATAKQLWEESERLVTRALAAGA